jgi:hypothetical protein
MSGIELVKLTSAVLQGFSEKLLAESPPKQVVGNVNLFITVG